MKPLSLLQTTFYTLGTLVLIVICMIQGQFILIPLAFSLLFAMLFNPAIKWLKKYVKNHTLAYFMTAIGFVASITIPFYFLAGEVTTLFSELSSEKFNVNNVLDKIIALLKENDLYSPALLDQATAGVGDGVQYIGSIIGDILTGSSNFFIYIILAIVFAYFLTSYVDDFKRILLSEVGGKNRAKWQEVMTSAPDIVRSYLGGTLIVMVILAILNGIVFAIIGVEFAIVWGLLIGLLAIIPYVGSAIGVILPMVYSFVQTGSTSQPLAIFIAFIIIQQIEGNFLTPKIVGDKINVNPMIIIILMMIFGKLWGVSGVIICLPLAGIVRVAMAQWENSEFIADIMSSKE